MILTKKRERDNFLSNELNFIFFLEYFLIIIKKEISLSNAHKLSLGTGGKSRLVAFQCIHV